MFEEIIELINDKKFSDLKRKLNDLNEADISELFDELKQEDIAVVFRLLDKDKAADVFAYFDPDIQEKLVEVLSDSELKLIVEDLFIDDAVDLVEEMPANLVNKILKNAKPDTRREINQLLKYPEDSAGSIMTTEYMYAYLNDKVKDVFKKIRKVGLTKEAIYIIYVTDESRVLKGYVEVKDLLLAHEDDLIKDIYDEETISCKTTDDKEIVAAMINKYDFMVMPVTDSEDRIVGIVTADDAMEVLVEEKDEDIAIMGGVTPSDDDYFKQSVFKQYKNRIIWLLLLMFSATITGMVTTSYEAAFEAIPLLVSFIPMVMDAGGNCGSQASTIIIRGLSNGEIELKDFFRVWWKEVRIALLCGLTMGLANGIRILIQYQGQDNCVSLAITIFFTLTFTAMLAKSMGVFLPMLAKKLKLDPAYMASPLITTIVDCCSLIIFFNLAMVIMSIQ